MDKTKLEKDLDFSEKKRSFSAGNMLTVLVICLIIAVLFFVVNMKESMSKQKEAIDALQKRINTIQIDVEKLKTAITKDKE